MLVYHNEVDTRCFECIADDVDEMTGRCEICGAPIPSEEDFCEGCRKDIYSTMGGFLIDWQAYGKKDGILDCITRWIEEQ